MIRVLRRLFQLAGLLLLAAVLGFVILAWQVDRLGRQGDVHPADVIVVLGARVNTDGQPGPDLSRRTVHAVDLWQAGYAPNIVCSGGFRNEPLSAASVCRRYAMALGVPAGRVWLADGSSSTLEDARVTASVMAEHGWKSAILVSHPLHVYRARWLFRRTGVDVQTSPTSTATERIEPPLRAWYAVREAGAIVLTALDQTGRLPPHWTALLRSLSEGLP
jgi:uncharacterized SAM-binding protein YcdF (DUF218 family)